MKLIYFLEKDMGVYFEKDSLFIICPMEGKGEHYNIDQLLYSFMKEVEYPVTRGKEKKEKNNQKRIYLHVGSKAEYTPYLEELIKKQIRYINEQPRGLLLTDEYLERTVDEKWKEKEEIESGKNISGNLDEKVESTFIDIKSGAQCKIYFLPQSIKTKEVRIIYNANIFFNNLLKVVEKKYHVIVLNEKLDGGIIYMHNKHARPGDNYYHKKYIIEGLKNLLIEQYGAYYDIEETYDITENFEGGYTKCPIKMKKKL